jgi:hypothetical protein
VDEAAARSIDLNLTRQIAVGTAEDELFNMTGHLLNLDALCSTCGYAEWRGGIEQVRAALLRLASDIEATKIARVQ